MNKKICLRILPLLLPVSFWFAGSAVAQSAPILAQIYALVDARQYDAPLLQKALATKDDAQLQQTLILIGRLGDPRALAIIEPLTNHSNSAVRRAAAFALGQTISPDAVRLIKNRLEEEKDRGVRDELLLGLGRQGDTDSLQFFMSLLDKSQDSAEQSAIYKAMTVAIVFHREKLRAIDSLPITDIFKIVKKQNKASATAAMLLSRLDGFGNHLAPEDFLALSKKDIDPLTLGYLLKIIRKAVSEHSLDTPVGHQLLRFVVAQSEHPSLHLRIEAARTLTSFWSLPQAQIQLGKLLLDPSYLVRSETLFALANSDIKDEHLNAMFKKQLKNMHPAMQLAAATGLILRQEKDDMSWLLKWIRTATPFNQIRVLSQLKQKAIAADEPKLFDGFIRFMQQSPDKKVAVFAKQLVAPKKAAKESPASSPDFATVSRYGGKILRLDTSEGQIDIELLNDAPYTAYHFAKLAEQGFFDGSFFHRVIGNFVAQGGDPIGDGEGSSGLTLREEISLLEHQPYTVGVATSGKDTGSSQFFINTARNLHLDRNYTLFGRVVSGQNVVDQLTMGSIILKARIQ